MESYVTRREFESALKELNKLQTFLVDTFGAKFVDFCRQKDIINDNENEHSAGAGICNNNDEDASVVMLEQCSEMEMTPMITSVRGAVAPQIIPGPRPGPTIVTVPVPPPAPIATVSISNSDPVPVPRPHTVGRHRALPLRFNMPPVMITRFNSIPTSTSTSTPTSDFNLNPDLDPLSDPPIPSFPAQHHHDQLQHHQQSERPVVTFPTYRSPPPLLNMSADKHATATATAPATTTNSASMIMNRMPMTFYKVTVNNPLPPPPPIFVPPPPIFVAGPVLASTSTSGGDGGGENATQNGPASKRPRTATTERLPSFRDKRSFSLPNSKPPPPPPPPKVPEVASTAPTNENEIIQCDTCQLFIYASQIDAHRKNHELMDSKISRSSSSSSSSSGSRSKVNSKKSSTSTSSTSTSATTTSKSESRKQKRNQDKLFQQPHTCPLCQVVCGDFQTYEDHCLETHPDGKPCPLCRKLLLRKTNLKRHMVIHRNLRFICDICGKGYGRSDNLVAHKKVHQEGEVMTMFFCGQCGSAFSSKQGRDKHLLELHRVQPTALITVAGGGGVGGHEDDLEEEEEEEDEEVNEESSDDPEILDSSIVVETIKVDGDAAAALEFEYEGDDE